jgi:hypothetical protein
MKARLLIVMTLTALCAVSAKADWQWAGVGSAENNIAQDESTTVWATEDCELISDAAGAYLYHSGETVKKSRETKYDKKKAALFKASVALSQLSVNHAQVYQVFCKQ